MKTPRLKDFQKIVFFTGAGMSAQSGVPTYRGAGGIWGSYDYETCACASAFARDPEHVWAFHNFRRELVSGCEPNAGHAKIAEVQRGRSVTVVTQNIDGLHQLAGSERVLELHGSLWQVRCDECGWRDEGRESPLHELRCPECDAYKRPNIVWFGDQLFLDVVTAAQEALAGCDLLVSVGTSAVVYPAAQLPLVARRAGAVLVEINPEETPLSEIYDVHLRGPATEMLARLDGEL